MKNQVKNLAPTKKERLISEVRGVSTSTPTFLIKGVQYECKGVRGNSWDDLVAKCTDESKIAYVYRVNDLTFEPEGATLPCALVAFVPKTEKE
jgi:hypothetical protein